MCPSFRSGGRADGVSADFECGGRRAVERLGYCRTMRYIAIILLSIAVLGCRQMRPYCVTDAGPTYVRVRNASGKDMLDVLFQGNRFGDIKNGASSDYQAGEFASWEISAGFPGNANRMQYVYVDSPGRMAYGKGRYTHVLTLHDNYGSPGQHLDITTERDK